MPQLDGPVSIKTPAELEKMRIGGKKLAFIKNELAGVIKPGVNAAQVEELANRLIEESGGKSSFKMVPGYSWSTCINVNEGVVHGIPTADLVFAKGDVVSIDVGLFYKGFHTDTSVSVAVEADSATNHFLEVGRQALNNAIEKARPGKRVYDISQAIQETLEAAELNPVRALIGHGVGKNLHEEPQIPCFVEGNRADSPELVVGMTLAIEVMYTQGSPNLVLDPDGWTISTADGKISGLFEDTVAITTTGTKILTR